ncbi:MAG: metal-dependent hydrolase [Pirellulaceae bacterium]|nr:MAG: metal-dependent hydrolase [Pirellulaceae bacterium]
MSEPVIDNAPYHRLAHGPWTVEGYSRAAVQTYWRIPELRVGFDLGGQPWDFMGTGTWFVSHTHLDHIAALPVYVARRRMMKMDPPTIYVPAHALDSIQRWLRAVSRLDCGRLPCQIVGLQPGDEVELSRELVVTASATCHTVPSLGYIVWERRRKLKPEFHGLPGEKIRDLRLSGVEVTDELRLPLVAYLGDSAPEGLDRCGAMYEAKVLIAEMTFLAAGHHRDKIHKHGHMHIEDFRERQERFRNERIIAAHFSTRYNNRQIERLVRKRFPDMLGGRLVLFP